MDAAPGPRGHAAPAFLAAARARRSDPHIAALEALVTQIRQTTGLDVPHVDPASGGVDARVLLLLEAPSGAAAHGSGLVSADNDDATAANLWRALAAGGLPRQETLLWNAVPWYLGTPGRLASPRAADLAAGRMWLVRLLDLLPRLAVVVTLGRTAQAAVAPLAAELDARDLVRLSAPHPSQRVYNRPGGTAREEVHTALAAAAHAAAPGGRAGRPDPAP